MQRARLQFLCVLVVAALGVACAGDSPTTPADESTLAVAPGDAQANGTVRGHVLGRVDGGSATEPVPGASVEVYHMEPDPDAPADTVLYRRRLVGTVVTGPEGGFELTSVPEGSYLLLVTPPADSPYLPGGDWAVTAPGTGVIDVTIVLERPRAPGVSDLQGEVRGWLTTDTTSGATEAVAGAEVRVYALEATADSGTYTRRLVGMAVTNAAGRFAFNDIPEGQYLQWSLDVTPPAGAPYRPVENQIVVASGTGLTEVLVALRR